jgi:drug/metabolite transporter (DMT)-like permease
MTALRLAPAPLSLTGLAQLAGSVVLLSSAWPVTKLAVSHGAPPLWFALGRAGFSALTAFALLAALRRLRRPGRCDMPAVLAVGLLQLAAFFALAHAAVAFVPAGRTAILSNITTLWIVPLSILLLREPIPPRRWLAAFMGVLGTVVLVGPWAIDWAAPGVLLGHVFLLAAALGFATAMVVVRRWPPRASMLELLPWCFGLATIALLPLAWAQGGGIGRWDAQTWQAMAYIGLVAGPFGTWCVMQAAVSLPAMVSSIGFLATPAAGLLISTLWLDEPLGPDLLAGSALISLGILCAAWPARRERVQATVGP